MTAVFTWTGFICLMALVLAVTVFAIPWLAQVIVRSSRITLRHLRLFWRFYESIPDKGSTNSLRYVATVYDRRENRFIVSEDVDEDFRTFDEHEAYWREMRELLSKKKQGAMEE